jgi:hypothetical protein
MNKMVNFKTSGLKISKSSYITPNQIKLSSLSPNIVLKSAYSIPYFCIIKTIHTFNKIGEALNFFILAACVSCVFFFLDPNPFTQVKLQFCFIVGGSVWCIYTLDHILDGLKTKGTSGIFRHDFCYKWRFILIPFTAALFGLIIWVVYRAQNELFIRQGLWLSPVIPIYFYLKHTYKLKPITKMLIISGIVATVLVNLFYENFYDILKLDWLLMFLLIFLNQLILKYYECNDTEEKLGFKDLANRMFIWTVVLVCITTPFNLAAWPQTLAMLCVAILLKVILSQTHWFKTHLLYRIFADFSFVLLWPLLKLFQLIFIALIR